MPTQSDARKLLKRRDSVDFIVDYDPLFEGTANAPTWYAVSFSVVHNVSFILL